MRKVIQKIILIGISVSILLGSLSNVIAVDHEQKNILKENLSNFITQHNATNGKLEQAVENLIKGNRISYGDKIKQIKDFDFVGEKVRLEIILSDKNKLDLLTAFNENIVIESSYENLVQALIPISCIESLSKEQFVNFMQKPIIAQPCVESEGVGVINADDVHNRGFYGDGIKVAIIDVGFTGYASNPEIPSQNIKELKSFRGDGLIETSEHGTACAEIVLDVAPHADLYLYVIGTDVDFCNALSYAVSSGIKIVSISLAFFNVNDLDGTGAICTAVNNARASGVLICNSVGNNAESHYCGWYTDSDYDNFHDFDTGYEYLDLGYLPAGYQIDLYLSWNDWPSSDQDYDLYLGRADDISWVDYSKNEQTGSQPPTEEIGVYAPASDYYFVCIAKYSTSSSVRFQLFSYYCTFYDNNHPETSLLCPSDATGAMTVGATYWQNDNLESFSSRGPTNDGRIKPDVTAPDYVSTLAYGPGGFPGTSASAPHTAGAAALLKSVDSTLTATQLQTVLETTALDLGSAGKDDLYGSGRIDVWSAYNSTIFNQPPIANFTYSPLNPKTSDMIQFTDTSTDSDGSINSWFWTFGDENTSIIQNPTHQYTSQGNYTVTLNVTDDDGATNETHHQLQIINLGSPYAVYGYVTLNGSPAPAGVEIIVSIPNRADHTGLTNSEGQYTVDFDAAQGETANFTVYVYNHYVQPVDNQSFQINHPSPHGYYINLSVQNIFEDPYSVYGYVTLNGNPSPADVEIILSIPNRINRTTLTNEIGQYTIDFIAAVGELATFTIHIGDQYLSPIDNKSFTIVDLSPYGYYINLSILIDLVFPQIIDHTLSIGYTGNSFTFNATITDNDQVVTAKVEYWYGTGTHTNVSMINVVDDYWVKTITIANTLNTLHYFISAKDPSNNWKTTAIKNVTIIDNVNPTFTDNSPNQGTTGDPYTFDIAASDNIGIASVTVNWTHGQYSHTNVPLNYDGDGTWSLTITLDNNLSSMDYRIKVKDTSDNMITGPQKTVPITDNDKPIITNASPANNSNNLPISTSTLSVIIQDPEGDPFNWTITTSPNVGSSSGTNANNGTKNCSISNLAYSTIYTWKVKVYDGVHWTNQTYQFTTASNPGGGGGGGGGGGEAPPAGPQNKKPVANASASEPYQGFVNSEILFDGSRSHDPDGNITKWFWVFGDNTNGTGKTVQHSYIKVGTYTVTLTVTDNEGATNTDTTTCAITQPNRPPTNPIITGSTNGTKNSVYTYTAFSTDLDNDTIKYTFDWGEPISPSSGYLPNGTSFTVNHSWTAAGRYDVTVTVTDNQTESSSKIMVYVNALQTGNIGYLTDDNGDGTYDTFHNDTTSQNTLVSKTGSNYLIDSNGDGNWEYTFDVTKGLTPYQPPKAPGVDTVLVIGVIIVAVICGLIVTVVLWKKKRIL